MLCSINKKVNKVKSKLNIVFKSTAHPSILFAASLFFSPNRIDIRVAEPIPIKAPNAIVRFIIGKVIASPEIANGPTPCPINIRSIILYNEAAAVAIIAGIEYCINSLPNRAVPSSFVFGIYSSYQKKL